MPRPLRTNHNGFIFQNATSGQRWSVYLTHHQDSTNVNSQPVEVTGRAHRPAGAAAPRGGTGAVVNFVVLDAHIDKFFGPNAWHETALAQGAFYNASNPAGTGVTLASLLA